MIVIDTLMKSILVVHCGKLGVFIFQVHLYKNVFTMNTKALTKNQYLNFFSLSFKLNFRVST